jgi:hypothetical protein
MRTLSVSQPIGANLSVCAGEWWKAFTLKGRNTEGLHGRIPPDNRFYVQLGQKKKNDDFEVYLTPLGELLSKLPEMSRHSTSVL